MEQGKIPTMELYEVVLDCKNVALLADFYSRLLGWENTYREGEWTAISSPSGGTKIAFQENEFYVPPVWPETPEKQQQMAHLDFNAEEMKLAVAHAISCGAVKAETQYSDQWTVLFDPEGHPFCILNHI